MDEKDQFMDELNHLRNKVNELERENSLFKETEKKLQAANQQLLASEQQLSANEQELMDKEAMTRQALEYAENIISTVREPLIILDSDLHVVSASQFFYSTFKVSSKETERELFYNLGNNQWNIPSFKKLLAEILPEKTVIENYEIEHDFEKIGKKTMLLNARELQQKKDNKRRILVSIQDITERKQAEQHLKRLNTELEAKTNELQQILYITTHDLRSPLVNIQGFNKELGTSLKELTKLFEGVAIPAAVKERLSFILNEDIPEAMHFITSSTNKMDALLTGLLTLSRLGRQKTFFKDINMPQLIQDVIDNFKYDINKNNVILSVSDLPDCKGDEFQINQLFSNLLSNALKFLDPERPGNIRISGEKGNEYIKFTVEDNGIGIHPHHQEKVFELFHKLNPQKPGIGLGMNIVNQILEKHKGKIELESEVNVGTKFIIFIPI